MRLGVALASLLFLQVFIGLAPSNNAQAKGVPDVFVGLDMAYGDSVAEAKRLIDEVSPYTNLFIIGCKGITYNTTRLNETCQYIVDKGLDFIVYRDTSLGRNSSWAEMAQKTWGDRFLGYYAFDELGGWQIDMHEWRMVVDTPSNYSDAADSFVSMAKYYLDRFTRFRNVTQFNLYTSDYALYWYDYEAGYDTVFAEFGWNYSRQLNIAQCRGAANMHGKDWGAIVTWTYTQPPYLGSGEELYRDLVLAYENGAKYIILFDANEGWTQSVLKQEHFDALKRFWGYIKEKPRQEIQISDRVAYVLPKDYGYGFRGPDDKIWGFWQADNLTGKICANLNYLLTKYDQKLDLIFDYNLLPGKTYGYIELFYWNDSSLPQLPSPPTVPATSAGFLPTPAQTVTPVPIDNPQSQIDYVPVIAIAAVIAVVVAPAYLLRKRQYNITFAATGIGSDYTSNVIIVDGIGYDKYGASLWWDSGSRHTYEFKSQIVVNRAQQCVKRYILVSTTGPGSEQQGTITVSRPSSLTGNYKPVYDISRHS